MAGLLTDDEVLAKSASPTVDAGKPYDKDFNTKLSPKEEASFKTWKAHYAPKDSGDDYDLRGAFKAGLTPDTKTGHWPDTFKKPNHPTFSDQSGYAQYGTPGRWEGEKFIPAAKPAQAGLLTDDEVLAKSDKSDKAKRRTPAQRAADEPSLADRIPDKRAPIVRDEPESILDKAKGVGEVALTLGTAGAGFFPSSLAALIAGTKGQDPEKRMEEFSRNTTYAPRTQAGQRYLGNTVEAIQDSGIAGLNPAVGAELSAVSAPARLAAGRAAARAAGAVTESAVDAGTGFRDTVKNLVKRADTSAMGGVGAAATDAERLAYERAMDLPVPIKLRKGQVAKGDERFIQQQFEREVAKDPKLGAPIRESDAEQNFKIQQNLQHWADQTGAEAPDLRGTGQSVYSAIVKKMAEKKTEIDVAYKKAREAGAMEEKIDVTPIEEFLKKNKAASINAGVITAVKRELDTIAGPQRKDVFGQAIPRTVSINDLEEIRKSTGALALKDATNGKYGKDIKKIIDQITEDKGGDEYKYARRQHQNFMSEFEDRSAIERLTANKPGTKDRAVAYEDVFNHSILNGSLDDVRHMRRVLQTAGTEGDQAWKELQGGTVNWILGQATKNASRDINGNPIVSFAGLNNAVKELDRDGKLDFLFGKQGAEQMREIRDLSADLFTAPPGSVNTSNTTSALLTALGAATKGHLPTAFKKGLEIVKDAHQNYKTRRRVQEAINPFPDAPPSDSASLRDLVARTSPAAQPGTSP